MPLTCWPSGLRDEELQPIQRRIMGRCDATTKYQLQGRWDRDWKAWRWMVMADSGGIARFTACISDIVVSFSNSYNRKTMVVILWNMNRGKLFSVSHVGGRNRSYEELWKQQVFTQCFTPRLMCYAKYSHMLKWRFPHLRWQLISQGAVRKIMLPTSYTVKPSEHWLEYEQWVACFLWNKPVNKTG